MSVAIILYVVTGTSNDQKVLWRSGLTKIDNLKIWIIYLKGSS